MVGAGRDAAEAILRGTVTALGLDGVTTVETVVGRGRSRPGVVRSGRRAWCDGHRRRDTRPRRAAGVPCSARCPTTWCATLRARSSLPAAVTTDSSAGHSAAVSRSPVDRRRLGVEAHEADELDRASVSTAPCRRRSWPPLRRVAVDARGDRREGDRACADPVGLLERAPVARSQQLRLAGVAAPPHRPDGVDHPPRGQAEARRGLGVAGGAPAEAAARRRAAPGRRPGGSPRRPRRRRAATGWPR